MRGPSGFKDGGVVWSSPAAERWRHQEEEEWSFLPVAVYGYDSSKELFVVQWKAVH